MPTFTLNAKGQRTHVEERVETQLVRTIDYTYDAADRLIEEQIEDVITGVRTISYTYDPVGNRLTKDDNGVITTYDYDDNDRLLTEGGFSYGYDNNGNLLSKTGNGEQYDFSYNALNQLVHAEIPTGGGTSTIDYVYDHDGIRVGKTINGTDVTTYVVDKNRPYAQVLEEQRTNGPLSAVARYVYGHGLVSQAIDGVKHYYHYDGFHSTRALSDMSGTVTDTYQYDAYGMLLNQTGATNNQYLYRSEQFDPELASYYLRARYYHPELGRFSSTDPLEGIISDPMTFHRYFYVNSDPVNNVDPSGQWSLNDTLLTVKIIGILSACSLGSWGLGEFIPDQYEWLAENFFPDAGIIGISAFAKVNINSRIMREIKELLQFMKPGGGFPSQILQPDYWPYHPVYDPSVQASGGLVFGGEAMWSFGSSQWGLFWYWGPQMEIQRYQPKWAGIDVSIYTGYVFNLWNCADYTGPFDAINFPVGSFFFDPTRLLGNRGPWGVSWPIISFGNSKTLFGGNYTTYRHPVGAWEVSYGKLAASWTVLQAAISTYYVFSYNKSAYVTMVGTAATGAIAKSKQIYNQNHYFYEIGTAPEETTHNAHYWRLQNDVNRPRNWRSGPPNPLSKLVGLFL